ncbi:hypothetical protein LCGC14_2108700, partial [marine sediment metagenome]
MKYIEDEDIGIKISKGGKILLGVDNKNQRIEKHKITDFEHVKRNLYNISRDLCFPPLNIDQSIIRYDTGDVCTIKISRRGVIPHAVTITPKINGFNHSLSYFIRTNFGSNQATPLQIYQMFI